MPCNFLLFEATVFLQISFRGKRDLSFALLDEWNVNNSIKRVKIYFPLCFMRINFFNTKDRKRQENCVATNFIIISKGALSNCAPTHSRLL